MKKKRVLFLCTGNSCRSQMAEGWARHLKGDQIEPYSAGIEAHGLNPDAVRVMAEAGVDISGQRSKRVDELREVAFDYVVTVCGHANESCPAWLGKKAKVVHASAARGLEIAYVDLRPERQAAVMVKNTRIQGTGAGVRKKS